MPRLKLPPLNALHTFEVAARHMSFKHAADELCITPTAVSHRIRSLEEWLEIKLFNRLTRSLEFTKEGQAYSTKVNQAFELIAIASDDVRSSSEDGELVISTTMSLASNWLTPKLLGFQTAFENLQVKVEGSDSLLDLSRSNVDIAIRFGQGNYEGLHYDMLFQDYVTPVCTPEYAEKLLTPEDLLEAPRIDYHWSDFSEKDPSWAKWFKAAGVNAPNLSPVPTFSDEHMVLTLAKAGKGIALIGTTAAAEYLISGQLVRPFPIAIENYTYYFTCLPQRLSSHKISAFYTWLKNEADCFNEVIETHPNIKFERIVLNDRG